MLENITLFRPAPDVAHICNNIAADKKNPAGAGLVRGAVRRLHLWQRPVYHMRCATASSIERHATAPQTTQ